MMHALHAHQLVHSPVQCRVCYVQYFQATMSTFSSKQHMCSEMLLKNSAADVPSPCMAILPDHLAVHIRHYSSSA